jgi:sugar lactone lactonase YvrE
MYVCNASAVFYYTLATPWDISTATYASSTYNFTAQETAGRDIALNADGTKLYVIGSTGDDINQYSLSTPWDVSSATFTKVSPLLTTGIASESTGETAPTGMYFRNDGKAIYFIGDTTDAVWRLNLSTAEDVATIGLGLYVQDVAPGHTGFCFKPDGTKLYIVSDTNNSVYQYSLSTSWDLYTASYDSVSYNVAARHTVPQDIDFKRDGTKFFIIDSNLDEVAPYDLATPWDISTATFSGANTVLGLSGPFSETVPTGLAFNSTGTRMFFVGQSRDTIFSVKLATAWEPSTRTGTAQQLILYDSTTLGGSALRTSHNDTAPNGVCVSYDDREIFVIGSPGVYRYKLAISTDLYIESSVENNTTSNYLVPPQFIGSFGQGIIFGDNGKYLYVCQSQDGLIAQVQLSNYSSPYSVMNVVGVGTLTIGYPFVVDMWIDSTGTEVYFLGDGFDGIAHYRLSTPWMISTATKITNPWADGGNGGYVNGVSGSAVAIYPHSFDIKPDRTKMFIVDEDRVLKEYAFGVAGDLTTLSYVRQISITGPNTRGSISFKPDGTRFIYGGNGFFYVNNMSTPWDINTRTLVKTVGMPGLQFGNASTVSAKWSPDGTRVPVSGLFATRIAILTIE